MHAQRGPMPGFFQLLTRSGEFEIDSQPQTESNSTKVMFRSLLGLRTLVMFSCASISLRTIHFLDSFYSLRWENGTFLQLRNWIWRLQLFFSLSLSFPFPRLEFPEGRAVKFLGKTVLSYFFSSPLKGKTGDSAAQENKVSGEKEKQKMESPKRG